MEKNLSSTAAVVEAVELSGIGARSGRGDGVKVSPSEGWVGPSGPALGKVDMCPTKPGPGGIGFGGDRKPGGECGKGNGGPPWGVMSYHVRGIPFQSEARYAPWKRRWRSLRPVVNRE